MSLLSPALSSSEKEREKKWVTSRFRAQDGVFVLERAAHSDLEAVLFAGDDAFGGVEFHEGLREALRLDTKVLVSAFQDSSIN